MKIKSINVKPTQEQLVLDAEKAIVKMCNNFECDRKCKGCPYYVCGTENNCAYDDVLTSIQYILFEYGYN